MPKLNVVDLYHGDVVESFARARQAGLLGVIHKATQGLKIVDPAYASRRRDAVAVGLLWGAYHFLTNETLAGQVTHFLSTAQPDQHTLVALDFEPYSNHTATLGQARAFLQAVRRELGRRAVLYSGNLIKELLGNTADPFFGSHRLWLAQYGTKPRVQRSWKTYWLWQYSGDGIGPEPWTIDGIPGASGHIDCNQYDGDVEQLTAEWAS